jgi:hypothetical protein
MEFSQKENTPQEGLAKLTCEEEGLIGVLMAQDPWRKS